MSLICMQGWCVIVLLLVLCKGVRGFMDIVVKRHLPILVNTMARVLYFYFLYDFSYVSTELCRYADGNEELLIGENDKIAAHALGLDFEAWKHDEYEEPQAPEFVKWAKEKIDEGCPVIAGFLQRYNEDEVDEEQEYDHIMPIIGYTRDAKGRLQFYFNDLWKPTVSVTMQLFADRMDFLTKDDPRQPFEYSLPKQEVFAIAIKGFKGTKDCYRCHLKLENFFFEPDWGAEDKLNQQPIDLYGDLTIIDLTPGDNYLIKCFHEVDRITQPISKAVANSVLNFKATGKREKIRVGPMRSDKSYFYRVIDAVDIV